MRLAFIKKQWLRIFTSLQHLLHIFWFSDVRLQGPSVCSPPWSEMMKDAVHVWMTHCNYNYYYAHIIIILLRWLIVKLP